MVLLSTPVRLHLWSLVRSARRIPPDIPLARFISIATGRHHARTFLPTPPTRRPPVPQAGPTLGKDQIKDKDKDDSEDAEPGPTRPRVERRPTNRQIPFDHVFVIDPETGKLSHTKRSMKELLLETRQGQLVELVASTPEPIVRVTARSEVEARYKAMKRAARRGAKVGGEPKEVRLTWGVAKADLEHKLRKGKRDLEKGYRVVVVVTIKKGHRPSSRRELLAFADGISETLCEVGEEWKERAFTERSMVLSFQKAELDDRADVP